MNNMEEKLWDYIDGTCSEEERLAIAALIEKDESWRKAFNNMSEINSDVSSLTLEEPSMAFSYKVMEGIRAHEAAKPLKTATNNYIISAIAGFFILSIVVLIVYLFSGTTQSVGGNNLNLDLPDFSALASASTIKIFFYTDVMLLLFLVDAFLRRKRGVNISKSV